MFDDKTMIVYGGYSQRCGDYCDDVWSFDLRDNTWMEIYPLGHFAEGLSWESWCVFHFVQIGSDRHTFAQVAVSVEVLTLAKLYEME